MDNFGSIALKQLLLLVKSQLDAKANSSEIPTKNSVLDNDSGYITTEVTGESWGGTVLKPGKMLCTLCWMN